MQYTTTWQTTSINVSNRKHKSNCKLSMSMHTNIQGAKRQHKLFCPSSYKNVTHEKKTRYLQKLRNKWSANKALVLSCQSVSQSIFTRLWHLCWWHSVLVALCPGTFCPLAICPDTNNDDKHSKELHTQLLFFTRLSNYVAVMSFNVLSLFLINLFKYLSTNHMELKLFVLLNYGIHLFGSIS